MQNGYFGLCIVSVPVLSTCWPCAVEGVCELFTAAYPLVYVYILVMKECDSVKPNRNWFPFPRKDATD